MPANLDLGGVIVATTLPFTADDSAPAGLAVDYDAYAKHCSWLIDNGCRGVGPNGSLGEYSSLTDEERRQVVRTAREAVGDRGLVVAGVHGIGWHQARGWAEAAAEDGADGVLLLPPTIYRANRSEVLTHYSKVNEVGLPIMMYNNPIDTKVDLTPDLIAELYELENVVAVKEFSLDARRVREIKDLCDIDVIAGADDLLFEALVAGATGWFAGYPNAFPREAVRLYELLVAGPRRGGAHAVRRDGPGVRLGLEDRVRAGDQVLGRRHRRERRRTDPAAARAADRGAAHDHPPRHRARAPRGRCSPDLRGMTPLRTIRAVDSHTEGMPTRVVLDGIGEIPGATMNERRLHFIAHLDDLRHFLMDEPRGHAAMSGAILQRPTRDDCDWGVVYIEVSGCLPMCGHGTIGLATVLVEERLVEVVEPVTTIRLDTPAGLVVARVAVSDGHADRVTIENVPSWTDRLDATIEVPGLGDRAVQPRVRRQLLRDGRPRRGRPAVRSLAAARHRRRRASRSWPRSTSRRRRTTPRSPASTTATTSSSSLPAPTRGCRATRWRSTRAGSTAPPAAPAPPRGWPSCTAVASSRSTPTSSTSRSSAAGSPGGWSAETTVDGRPAVVPTITGRAWITGRAEYLLDPSDPFPNGFVVLSRPDALEPTDPFPDTEVRRHRAQTAADAARPSPHRCSPRPRRGLAPPRMLAVADALEAAADELVPIAQRGDRA